MDAHLILHKKGVLCTTVLSASPIEREQAVMESVREAVCLDHHNLEKVACVLQKMDGTALIGTKILEQYRKYHNVQRL